MEEANVVGGYEEKEQRERRTRLHSRPGRK